MASPPSIACTALCDRCCQVVRKRHDRHPLAAGDLHRVSRAAKDPPNLAVDPLLRLPLSGCLILPPHFTIPSNYNLESTKGAIDLHARVLRNRMRLTTAVLASAKPDDLSDHRRRPKCLNCQLTSFTRKRAKLRDNADQQKQRGGKVSIGHLATTHTHTLEVKYSFTPQATRTLRPRALAPTLDSADYIGHPRPAPHQEEYRGMTPRRNARCQTSSPSSVHKRSSSLRRPRMWSSSNAATIFFSRYLLTKLSRPSSRSCT